MSEEKKLPRRVKVRVFRESPEAFFRAGFERIANTRMKGIPICNPKLRVATVPFRKVDGQWVGAVVTPWSILVLRACGDPRTWNRIPETKVAPVTLPAGDFSFMGIADPDLGEYQSCSLLSPTWEIGDQATGEAVARIALETMLKTAEEGNAPAPEEKAPTPPKKDEPARVSKREFFMNAVRASEGGSGKETKK